MARNSDLVREGQSGLPDPNQAQANPPPQTPPGEAGTFQSVPGVREQPPLEKMGDFPILSQIHAEVGTMAVVVQQINQITDFIQAFASTGEMPTSLHNSPRGRLPSLEGLQRIKTSLVFGSRQYEASSASAARPPMACSMSSKLGPDLKPGGRRP